MLSKRWKSFGKFLIFLVVILVVVTYGPIRTILWQGVLDFFTLPITDDRVTEIGISVWALVFGTIAWLVVGFIVCGIVPMKKSKTVFWLTFLTYAVVTAPFFFPWLVSLAGKI